jgi:integrase
MMAKRRANGEGNIRKRENGQWEGRIVVGHKENGKPIFRYVYGETQKELTAKLRNHIEIHDGVELTEDSRMTLGAWLVRWLGSVETRLRSSTVNGYRQYITNYINPVLGEKQISKITTTDVQKMYTRLKHEGRVHEHREHGRQLSDAMVRKIHMMLHRAMEDAKREHLIASNPTDGATVPKASYKEKQILNDEQLARFMEAIKADPAWHDFFYTAVTTGLRRGELCGLRWEDFDKADGTLHIRRTVHVEKGGRLTTGATKTGSGTRKILLPTSTARLLQERKRSTASEWIFPNPLNPELPTSPTSAYHHLKTLLKRANLPSIGTHGIRHTFSSHALASGVDPKTLSGILGHTKASFTLDTYTHVTGDMQRQAATIVGDFLTDIFGKELKPWQNDENPAPGAST